MFIVMLYLKQQKAINSQRGNGLETPRNYISVRRCRMAKKIGAAAWTFIYVFIGTLAITQIIELGLVKNDLEGEISKELLVCYVVALSAMTFKLLEVKEDSKVK